MTAKKYLETVTRNCKYKLLVQREFPKVIPLFEIGDEIECYEDDAERLWEVVGTEIEEVHHPAGYIFRRAKFGKELLREYLDEIKCSQYAATVVVGL